MSGTRTVKIQQIYVGIYPYILIELKPPKGDKEGVGLTLSAGGFGEVGEPETQQEFVECIEELLDMIREAE